MEKTGSSPFDIHAIASHGQTIHHIPPEGKKRGSTLQIGESAVIAERTGVLTISDFRTRDMAAMGHGAPLVPLADHMLFAEEGKKRAVLNIGGIANVTILSGELSETIAFDTGPGNSLMDEAVKIYSSGKKAFDRGGAMARSGKAHRGLLDSLLCHPYLKKRHPKSTGRETFGRELVEEIMEMYNLSKENTLATICHFTAVTIHDAIAPFAPHELIVTGGGMKNPLLMELLADLFDGEGIPVRPITDFGIPPEAKEALSFAILGYRTLTQSFGNVPSATGARHDAILGKITLP
jgi:anhydro-N-acetylmuramic acid kinase